MVDVLKVSNVSKKFAGNDFYSLRNINLTVEEGDIVGLIGKNGFGKSTLLKCIAKIYIPTEGAITYRQHDLLKKSNMLDDFGIMIETVFYPQLKRCVNRIWLTPKKDSSFEFVVSVVVVFARSSAGYLENLLNSIFQ